MSTIPHSAAIAAVFPDTRGVPGIPQLAARFDELLDQVRVIADPLRGVELSASGIAAAGPQAAKAYLQLERLAEEHRVIRACQGWARSRVGLEHLAAELYPSPYPAVTLTGKVSLFFDAAAWPEISPAAFAATPGTCRRPGPDGLLERTLWLATDPAAEAWVPDLDAEAARWQEVVEHIKVMRRSRRRGVPAVRVP
jgi:hypothetical protein